MQNREFQRWEGWEKQYLKVNYLNVSDNLLANKLQRSTTAVKQYRINKLKLKRYDDVGFNKQLNEKYFIIRNAFIERSKIIRIHKQVTEMKSLIKACENETSILKRALEYGLEKGFKYTYQIPLEAVDKIILENP